MAGIVWTGEEAWGVLRRWARAFCLLAFLGPIPGSGQGPGRDWTAYAYPATFEHLSVEQGLSQSTVRSILQDRKGFLWFGTESGLNRYDGLHFRTFHSQKGTPHGLGGDWILCLLEDHRGLIWVGTRNGGLSYVDPETNEVVTFPPTSEPGGLPSATINALTEDPQGNIWIATETHGLCLLPATWNPGSPLRFQWVSAYDSPQSPPAGRVNALCVDHQGTLWIGSKGHGLGRLVEHRKEFAAFEYFSFDPKHPETSCPIFFSVLKEDRFGMLWLGAHNGLWRFDPGSGRFTCCHTQPAREDIAKYRVISLAQSPSGAMWIVSDGGGLYKALPRQHGEELPRLLHYTHDPRNPGSLSSNAGDFVFEDRSGVLWVSTFQTGLNKLVLNPGRPLEGEKPLLFQYRNNAAEPASLSGNLVSAIGQDRFGSLWVGTDGSGLNRAVRPSSPELPLRFDRYREDPRHGPGSLQNDVILTIYLDHKGQLWMGSYDAGLIRVDQTSATSAPRFTHFQNDPKDPESLSSNFIRAILEDGKGRYWVATDMEGLNLFDPASGKCKRYGVGDGLSNPVIWSMVKDTFGTLWLGTADGLNRFNPETGEFKVYRAGGSGCLSEACIQSLHLDAEGTLWIGTAGGGLNRATVPAWAGPEPQFKSYGLEEGLPDLRISAILPGTAGELWLSTARRLCRFDIRQGQAQRFPWQAGLQKSEFIKNACFRSPKGELLFGGNDGLTLFNPRDVAINPILPPLAITDFQVQGRSIPLRERMPKGGADRGVPEITLTARDTSFSFDLAALHFAAPEQNHISYLLEGLDSSWKEAGSQHSITFTTLPPGHYTLRVKASNCDGIWNEPGLQLRIHALPPWYKTWWFRGLALCGVFSLVFFTVRGRLRRLQSLNEFLEAQVQRRTHTITEQNQALESANLQLLEVDKLKGNMAAVLVHDLRTPLSVIYSSLDLLELDGVLDMKLLGNCRRSAQSMLTMLTDLLEVFRSEGTTLKLELKPLSVSILLKELQSTFQPLCLAKHVVMTLNVPEEPCQILGDESKVERAISNLVVNALKFTPDGGTITLTAQKLPGSGVETGLNWLLLKVQDTGRGIPPEELPYIFDPYRQVRREDADLGVGLGLAIVQRIMAAHKGRVTVRSQVGVGTDFMLLFPLLDDE